MRTLHDILEACKARWLTVREVSDRAGICIESARHWLPVMESRGMLRGRPRTKQPAARRQQSAGQAAARVPQTY